MIEQTLKDAVSNNWPMLLIFTVVIVTIRITYLVVHKDKFVLYFSGVFKFSHTYI